MQNAAALDRRRSQHFLEKADAEQPDAFLAGLRSTGDAALGIDEPFLRNAMTAFGIPPAAPVGRSPVQGTFHRLYEVGAGDGPLLRVAAIAGDEMADSMALEADAMHALKAAGLPVPGCEFRRIGDRGTQLVARAAGASLTTWDEDEPRMLEKLAWVARFLRTLHRIRGTGFGPISASRSSAREGRFAGVHDRWEEYLLVRLDEHIAACEGIGAIDAGEGREAAQAFRSPSRPLSVTASSLLHGDPGSHNFLLDDTAIRAVIDWEDALLGDPLFDLASLCTFHPERRHAAIWRGYGARLDEGGEDRHRFWLYFLRIALAKTVHRHRFGYRDRAGRAPASRRIQLGLARLRERA